MIEHNGKLYHRVSEVLGPYSGYGSVPKDMLNRKADMGTRTHKTIDGIFKGLGDWCAPDIKGYVDSFKRIYPRIGKIEHTEDRFFSDELQLTGQIDLIGEFDGKLALMDWKTSYSPNKTWPLQGAAYTRLSAFLGISCIFVQLDKTGGEPNLFIYDPETQERDWITFLECFSVYKRFFNKEPEQCVAH